MSFRFYLIWYVSPRFSGRRRKTLILGENDSQAREKAKRFLGEVDIQSCQEMSEYEAQLAFGNRFGVQAYLQREDKHIYEASIKQKCKPRRKRFAPGRIVFGSNW